MYSKGGCIIRPIDSYDSVATNHVLEFHAQKNSTQSRVCIYFENSPKSSLIPLAEARSGWVKLWTIIANVSDYSRERLRITYYVHVTGQNMETDELCTV